MGVWDVLRGHSRPRAPQLDQLFAVPSAALTLESELGLRATGTGSVVFRVAAGEAARLAYDEAAGLVATTPGVRLETRVDEYGYTWVTLHTDPPDAGVLVTQLHAVNLALEAQGFGPGLLCSVVEFADSATSSAYVVYLYKQGGFYPFCPTGTNTRDSMWERQIRDAVAEELPIEPDPARWLPLWGMERP